MQPPPSSAAPFNWDFSISQRPNCFPSCGGQRTTKATFIGATYSFWRGVQLSHLLDYFTKTKPSQTLHTPDKDLQTGIWFLKLHAPCQTVQCISATYHNKFSSFRFNDINVTQQWHSFSANVVLITIPWYDQLNGVTDSIWIETLRYFKGMTPTPLEWYELTLWRPRPTSIIVWKSNEFITSGPSESQGTTL